MNQKNKGKGTKKIWPTIAFLICLVSEAAFLFSLMALDALPGKYVALILVGIAILDAAMILLFYVKGNKKAARIGGFILSILVLAVMCVGTYYVYNTYKTLGNLSEYRAHWEEFDVVVAKGSTYENAGDIKGQKVYAYDDKSKMYAEAREKLVTKSEVEYEMLASSNEVSKELVDNGTVHPGNIIFISDNNYQMICDEDKDFKKNTEVLFQIRVVKRDSENDTEGQIDVTEDPFNFCISGIDMWGTINQVSRSDVNMIVTVNPQTHTILLTSMPRDSYVVLHTYQQLDKLTHSGVYGIDETTSTIEDWLDIDIHYYARVNFHMVQEMVNAIGGIDVYSETAFDSTISHWKYKKGWNHLTGTAALYFCRERHSFEDEDQQRIKNQQKVVEATFKKITKSETLLTSYTDILKAVNDYMETDMSQKDMSKLVKMQLKDMPKWKIYKQSVVGDLTMKGTYSMGFGRDLLVSIPRDESVEEVKENIHKVMYPDSTEKNKN